MAAVAFSVFGQASLSLADNDDRARKFVAQHEATIRPLEIAAGKRWWAANVSGKDKDFEAKQEIETKLDLELANRERFAELKAIHESKISDPILAREIEVLYLQYLGKQVDPDLLKRILARTNAIEKAFNTHRPKVNGKELTASDIQKVLKTSKDSAERRAAWEASKTVGAVVEAELRALVELRNQAARQLGFADYHAMQLQLNEQTQEQVIKLFDELDELTREPFRKAKAEIDQRLAANCNIPVDELRPWHYHDPFFQESPAVFNSNIDAVYANQDILALCKKFYTGIGLPIDDVLARSDLYEKPGKSPHAFCTDIDREGDVRVLANIVPNEYWMGTMLHELGHAVYSSKNIPRSLPYVLRSDAHILATEGVAMMFQRFSKSADFLKELGVTVDDPKTFNETGERMRRNQLLIFSRWCQVVLRFEKELYGNPNQDLNKLWWDLVEKYQMVRRPEGRNAPDYAAKIHIVTVPAYYHNYMMGELFACQVHRALIREVLGGKDSPVGYVGNPRVGDFMRSKVFDLGRTRSWNELTKFATGEPLNAQAFATDFSEK
jgi:peptidyl-dipeptidase A